MPVSDIVSPDSTYLTYRVTYPLDDSVDGIEYNTFALIPVVIPSIICPFN
jgi:hypothetical protein